MGGDGGVVATNRKYLRGAGSADQTADHPGNSASALAEDAREIMTTCSLTKNKLFSAASASSHPPVVACPYGRLYLKEAALEALLRRKNELGDHVKSMKDLSDVRFQLAKSKGGELVPCCPITQKELVGAIPAVALLPGKGGSVNVVSDGARAQLGDEALGDEYGPIEQTLRLAPTGTFLEDIKKEHAQKLEDKKLRKKKNKKTSKRTGDKCEKEVRKRPRDNEKASSKSSSTVSSSSVPAVADVARKSVASAVQSNSVLSSLFVKEGKGNNAMSDKQRKDHLFARMG